jgi:hypothetical protein
MDISAGTWAYDLLASECGIGPEMLPEFAAAGTRAGGLLDAVAEQVGLPAGLPVHLGGGDTHMSALAAGGQASGGPVVVAGTTGPVQLAVRAPLSLDAWFPLLVSPLPGRPLPAGNGWALESNTGPTGEIVDRLHDLSQLSGPGLRATLLARGFHVDSTLGYSLLRRPDDPGRQSLLRAERLAHLARADHLRPHSPAHWRRPARRRADRHVPGLQRGPRPAVRRVRVPQRHGDRDRRHEPQRGMEPDPGRRDRPQRARPRA